MQFLCKIVLGFIHWIIDILCFIKLSHNCLRCDTDRQYWYQVLQLGDLNGHLIHSPLLGPTVYGIETQEL